MLLAAAVQRVYRWVGLEREKKERECEKIHTMRALDARMHTDRERRRIDKQPAGRQETDRRRTDRQRWWTGRDRRMTETDRRRTKIRETEDRQTEDRERWRTGRDRRRTDRMRRTDTDGG